MIDEIIGFLLLISFITLTLLYINERVEFSILMEKNITKIAEKCIDHYYNKTKPTTFNCIVYDKFIPSTVKPPSDLV